MCFNLTSCFYLYQINTGKTVLFAEDKLDDGNPIVLQVTINDDEVSSMYLLSMCLTSFLCLYRAVLFLILLELELKFHII